MSRLRLLLCACVLALAGCASARMVDAGPPIRLQHMMGTWYVIAHVPYFTERGHVSARHEYALLPDDKVAVRYVYRTGFQAPVKTLEATATVLPGSGNRDWRMRFFRVVPATQHVLEVAPDNSWALLTTPDRDLAWVFARSADMSDATYQSLLARLRDHGINSDKVWRIAHEPEQVGRLGFERPNEG